MAQWVEMFLSRPEGLSSFNPGGEKGEAIPPSCSLACSVLLHIHINTHTAFFFFFNAFLGRMPWRGFSVERILVNKNDSSLWEKGRHCSWRAVMEIDPSLVCF